MSKGSTIVPVRIPADLLAEVDATCTRLVATSACEPPDRSQFIRRAIREKLDHYRRSRRRRAPRRRVVASVRGVLHPGLTWAVYAGGAR